jgi:hypothetical protein
MSGGPHVGLVGIHQDRPLASQEITLVVPGLILATDKREKQNLLCHIVHLNNKLPFCTAGQIVVCVGREHGASEMAQPLD